MEDIKLNDTNDNVKPKKSNGFKKFIGWFTFLLIIFSALYIYWFYFNPYSEGEQSGIINKISRKGNIFKTYEGYITSVMPNTIIQQGTSSRNVLFFSVVDKSIADSLNNIENKIVKIHYTQYRKSLPWRGENYNDKNAEPGQYIVDKIVQVNNAAANN